MTSTKRAKIWLLFCFHRTGWELRRCVLWCVLRLHDSYLGCCVFVKKKEIKCLENTAGNCSQTAVNTNSSFTVSYLSPFFKNSRDEALVPDCGVKKKVE